MSYGHDDGGVDSGILAQRDAESLNRHTVSDTTSDPIDPPLVCVQCEIAGAEVYCIKCDSLTKATPYHIQCWDKQVLHRRKGAPKHPQIGVKDIERLAYINEPNNREDIEEKTLNDDNENCFIEFNLQAHKLELGRRARPLLRHDHNVRRSLQHPSFVSFIGHTMSGKSFLIRALLHGSPSDQFPSPIPAPGAKEHNFTSTSSDINLYADWKTAETKSPILFLDCEGLEGSMSPTTLTKNSTKGAKPRPTEVRRAFVENAYPRFVYTFSTSVVFVTSRPLGGATAIGKQLITYASSGAGGSRNQTFQPSLFIVFNRSDAGDKPGFDWSISSSTRRFLEHGELTDLKLFYSTIHVIYIPLAHKDKSDIALSQIDAFQRLLREQHTKAYTRRLEFNLALPSDELQNVLYRAVDVFSTSSNPVFNWSIERSSHRIGSNAGAIFNDLWTQCTAHFADPVRSVSEVYNLTRVMFEKHLEFCLLLARSRRPHHGVHFTAIPKYLDDLIDIIDDLLRDYIPCSASSGGTGCQETKSRHANYHQGLIRGSNKALRWSGLYQEDEMIKPQSFREAFQRALENRPGKVSLCDLADTLSPDIFSFTSCFGCLHATPNTILACKHSFCFDCIRDLAVSPLLHRLELVHCPFHKTPQRFSPRLLPTQSGYRILSLDGGGVKGLSELVILKYIEERCFDIPTVELYDLIVGTSIGGEIALALTAPGPNKPLTVAALTEKFKEMMAKGFVRKTSKLLSASGIPWLFSKAIYKASTVERQLQTLFGVDAKFPLAAAHPKSNSLPNVAVTTVQLDSFKAHVVANYNRRADSNVLPMLATSDLDECMSTWAMARCTSAALPYFKAFSWQGQLLLDGGFQYNCPAPVANGEAVAIWPEKRRDIFVSLGTGVGTVREQSSPNTLQVFKRMVEVVTRSEEIWAKFANLHRGKTRHSLFRLNPKYAGGGFALDDFQRLDEIEMQTKAWLLTQDAEVTAICNQLIAAPFFFVQTKGLEGGKLTGYILCRLPVELDARKRLFKEMGNDPDSTPFVVEFIHKNRPLVKIRGGDLAHTKVGEELRIPVELHDLPDEGRIEIQIYMQSFRDSSGHQCPISGSPYVIRG